MASTLGGWYLNGSTLQYRLLNGETLTSTVLASITGLTGLKMEGEVVKVNRGNGSWTEINSENEKDITVTATEAVAANPEANPPVAAVPETATFKISDALLGTSKISVSGSTNYTAYLDLVNDKSKVHIDGTEVINYDKNGGKATIVGDLTAGFTLNNLNGNATSASYSNAAVNQTLATVSGLAKNYTASTDKNEVTTVAFAETTKDTNGKVTKAGEIKLSKVTDVKGADATTVSALGTGAISVSMSKVANDNGISYYLKLGEPSVGDYEQKDSTDEAAYWTVSGTKATYQYYSPTGYQLTDKDGNLISSDAGEADIAKATKIKVTAAKTTTVLTVEGLANDITTNVTDTKIAEAKKSVENTRTESIATEVGIGQARLGENTSAANSFITGITVTTNVSSNNKPVYESDGKTLKTAGKVTINITRAVLPTKGTVTVKAGKGFNVNTTTNVTKTTDTVNGNDFYTNEDATKTSGDVKQQRIWVINGNTAIYKEVDLAYYTVGTDKSGNAIITCTPQTNGTVLATIKNLNVDWLANEANLTRNTKDTNGVITAIKGITFTKDATYTYDDKGVPKVTSDSVVGEITLSKEVLSDKNVTINKSDNFKLALLAADDSDAGTTKAELPAFSNYKWNLNTNGTIATLKGTIGAGYMAADDGKTITYVAGGDNQTLATVNGLKKGTQLERDTTSDETETNYRRIGNYIGDPSVSGNFVVGLKINTSGTLSHGTIAGSKTLNRLTLTLSEHVMDTSKISLNSNYYTLAVDKTDKGNTIDNDITKKANSRTYVLEKTELYDQVSETDSSGKTKTVDKPKTDAEAIVGWHGSLGSTAILKETVPACYELVKNNTETAVTSINYIKPGTAKTLATVKGLNKDITENDISFDTEKHVITILNSNALTTSNVTIEKPKDATVTYKLAISNEDNTGISEATLSDLTWSQLANGTVNFTSNVTSAGYKLNADANTITYTKEATTTATTLATITGLRKDLTQITTDGDTKGQYVGVKFNQNDGTITLSKSALNNANVKISGSANYKLVINKTDDGTAITGPKMTVDSQEKDYSSVYIPTAAETQKNVWSISGSTATLQDMKSDYYKYDGTANTLTYVKAEVDKYTEAEATAASNASLKGKNKVYGQIKGLASGLFTSADGKSIGYYNDSGVFTNAVTIDTANSKIEIVDAKALGTSTISLDGDLKTNYTIALSTTLADNQKPALVPGTDPEWTINRGTATYKGNIGAGFSNSSDGKSIVYSKAQNNATIATITGLDTTLTTNSLEALMASTDGGSTPGTGLQFGTGNDANVITVYNDVLGNSDVKLTTNVAVLGKDYKLKLATATDNTDQAVKSTYEATETTQVWSIDKTTATYGTKTPTYYTLNEGTQENPGLSDTITYHGEGVTDENKILTISGLASGLVTIKDDLIRGISVGTTSGTTFTADNDQTKATGTVFQLSSNVLPEKVGSEIVLTKLHDTDSKSYTLFLDASDTSIPTPSEGRIYSIAKSGSATVTITDKRTAGYEYGTKTEGSSTTKDQTKIVYSEEKQTGNKLIGTITGLSTTIEKKADGTIDGITVTDPSGTISSSNPGKITLDKKVLRNGNVELTSENYVLTDATGVAATNSEATWTKSGNAYELHIGKTAVTYTLDSTKKKLTYGGGGDAGSVVAKITGLKNTDDISVTGTTITIGAGSLNAKAVTIENQGNNSYTLALKTDVSASASTNSWELNNGTATFTQAVTAGYAVATGTDAGKKIIYTPASSIVTTFNNLSKEITSITTEDSDNILVSTKTTDNTDAENPVETKTGIKFVAADNNKGIFTFTDENLLAHKQVKLTTKATGKDADGNNVSGDYTIVLDNDIAAKTASPVWNKATNATTATLTETTAAGYSLATDSKSINYSSDPTTVTLATVSGLNKESVVKSDGSAVGIETTTIDESKNPPTETTKFTAGLVVTKPQSGNDTGVITIGNNVLNKTAVKLGTNDKYEFDLGTDVPDKNSASEKNIWTANGTTYTYKPVIPLYYAFATKKVNNDEIEDTKTINYIAQADVKENNVVKTITTIKGLKSGLTINDDGSIDGLDTTSETRVTLSAKVLGTSDITSDKLNIQLASSDEDLVLASQTTKWKDQTEWVGNGNTYNLKKYDKAYYKEDGDKTIKYTKETTGTTYATITNLASDLKDSDIAFTQSDDDDKSKGGVIKISKAQLIGKDVTVKASNGGGVFTLELDDDVTQSTISDETWSKSNATTAVLKGKQSQGYTLSEDAKAITYQKDNGKEITLATVSGLKSGATIEASNVTKVMATTSTGTQSGGDVATAVNGDEGSTSTNTNQVDTGKRIITLNKTQLGTANVTVKGDGYTLAVADDAKSKTEDAAWVKADNATKATFTQKTYNGFTESADGKTLTYVKATSNIDLATINGLSKDLKQSQMAVINNNTDPSEYANALVVLNTETKVITVKKAALSGKVTLGNKDDYTFALDEGEDKGSGTEADGKFGGDSVDAQLTFNNGTLSIVKGTTDAWELSADAKTINWTKADYATLATVANLPKTLTYTPGENNPLEAVTVSGDTITVDDAAVAGLSNNGKITLSNKTVDSLLSEYTFAFATGSSLAAKAKEASITSATNKRWALSGTNLSLKEYTPAYYLPSVDSVKHEETITYIAEKTGSELAKIAGLPTGLYQDTVDPDNPLICLADGQTSAIAADMNDVGNKTITIMSGLTGNTDLETKDLTFTLTSNKGYTFSSEGAIAEAGEPTSDPVAFDQNKSFTATASKGEVALLENTSHGWSLESATKITHKKAVDKTVATIKGINKEFNYNVSQNDLSVDTGNNIITVGKAALTESNVTLTIPNDGTLYNLALGTNVNSNVNANTTSAWESITGWAVSGGTATYKTYNDGNYYVKADSNTSKPNSIVYVKPTSGTPYATITGLNKTIKGGVEHEADDNSDNIITLGKTELEGTSKVTLAIKTASSVNASVEGANQINKKIETGNTTAAKFKLALDTTSSLAVTASTIEHAVWDTNGTVANLTGTITKGYRLSNDQKTITYQAADSKLQVIAKVSNIKAGSQILDSNVTNSGDNDYLPNLKKITLKNEHLGTSNVMLTGEGYKLALDDDVIRTTVKADGSEDPSMWHDVTEWVNNNGTFTYKTYDKIHYTLDSDGKRVTYTAAKDDKNNPNHQTYAQISGLSKTALSTAIDDATSVDSSSDSIVTANDGVISLTADLFTEANVKLTDSQNGGYTLAFGDDVASIKSSVSNFQAAVSGTSATWTGTIGKGYFLANDGQNITYYNAAKTKQSLAKITGLNATISSNNNDAFSGKYNANTNTVTLAKADLSEKVVINSGIVAFNISNDYTGGNVTGSNAADRISLTGGNNSINAGGGNDYVQLGGGSNTFFYASGNGNDVIVGFTNDDTLKVTNVVGTTVTTKKVTDGSTGKEKEVKIYKNNIEVYQDEKNTADALVKVNNNVIRIKGMGSNISNLTVQDKDNNEWDSSWKHEDDYNDITKGSFIQKDTANVLADDNYAMTPNLSSIVKNSTASYAADDLVADDATSLTKQSTAVSYSDKK